MIGSSTIRQSFSLKKIYSAFLLVLLLFCISTVANAEDGWVKEGDYLYYYRDGVKATGSDQRISNTFYSFTDDGKFIADESALVEIESDYYFFGAENKLLTGWQTINGEKYYFDQDSKTAKTGFLLIFTELNNIFLFSPSIIWDRFTSSLQNLP